ncbi:MAG: hypothetical protein EU541_06040 [Promethearchaeota archaeon]|nr:MAG: hypothetical protein EU541_06040 [Candidatus Lokiarchaeota archaeon]
MSMKRVLETLRENDKEFTTAAEIKDYSRKFYYNFNNVIRYLVNQKYLLQIFEGIYYVKSEQEIESKKLKYSLLELVGKGLELKGITDWYYGLYTALTLNGVKEEEHDKDLFYIITNRLFKGAPIEIAGRSFKFIKFKYSLFNFGIIDRKVKFSDKEKTVLDFIYLWKYNGIHSQKIIVDIAKYMDMVEEEKILDYVRYYPKTNKRILKEALSKR